MPDERVAPGTAGPAQALSQVLARRRGIHPFGDAIVGIAGLYTEICVAMP
jgi:hypothetical protein